MRVLTGTGKEQAIEVSEAGWVHCFGIYQSRRQPQRHQASAWSRNIIRVKRKCPGAIDSFGKVIAGHLERLMEEGQEYVVTHVPSAAPEERYLFPEFDRCALELLTESIHGHLGMTNVRAATVLAQTGKKPCKQHSCQSNARRRANVAGIYTVCRPELVWGKRIILVDDVVTSGATISECERVLVSSGAQSVMGIAVARTERRERGSFVVILDEGPDGDAA